MPEALAINGRQVGSPFAGGVVRYATELSNRLSAEIVSPSASAASGPLGHLWEQTALLSKTRKQVLFSPANFGPILHQRHIVTIHDVSPLDHPEWFSASYVRLYKAVVPRLARKAKVVLTDSEFSRQRIRHTLGVDSIVASVGVGAPFIDAPDGARGGTVVVVGGSDPRKNVDAILAAWPLVTEARPECELVVVGGERSAWVFGGSKVSEEGARSSQLSNVSYRSDIDDSELVALLSSAGAAVFCSLYEGFGLPALEALATGTPVVCSDIPPLREFADGAAVFVDPSSPPAIAAGILRALDDPPVSGPEARAIARNYSWERTASTIRGIVADL